MGRFIEIEVEIGGERLDRSTASAVVRQCPVDIFALDGERLTTHPEREDECILCGRCVTLAPDAVSVRRAYGARRPVVAAVEGGHDA
jgi:NAD-dependent dihydropyrimidine dehydrogenase PreA subunit